MNPLHAHRQRRLTLAELEAAAAELLARGPSASDERVAAAPDARTIRYYQSLGILDRPLGYEGRQAIYGYRHLLQAVATKLLQAKGYSLAQVQRALTGATDPRLEAAIAEALGDAPPAAPPPAHRALVAVEVAPGVVVTVDPAKVSDPEALLTRISKLLAP